MTMMSFSFLFRFLLISALMGGNVAFVSHAPTFGGQRRAVEHTMALRLGMTSNNGMFKQKPGESSLAYMKRLQQLASDPAAFEQAKTGSKATTVMSNQKSSHQEGDDSSSSSSEQQRPRGYQRAEDWEADLAAKQKNSTNDRWDERVQFDGLRYGNRYQQNEILRKNLQGF